MRVSRPRVRGSRHAPGAASGRTCDAAADWEASSRRTSIRWLSRRCARLGPVRRLRPSFVGYTRASIPRAVSGCPDRKSRWFRDERIDIVSCEPRSWRQWLPNWWEKLVRGPKRMPIPMCSCCVPAAGAVGGTML
ncbi:uncharacterized protein [Dermacentor andersoni]|uniref:uncharacterized protein isoform X2 n=1 Tax=Dermacentor andersoni TaxID=34620 RepID=UPI002416E77F|nr:uncharacterized protein LOC129387311 isoform X2 [Dermacentor andersoni]